MSDNIKYQSKKIYQIDSPKARFIHEYVKQYISDITESPTIILPKATDFVEDDDYIHQLLEKFGVLSNKRYELTKDISIELKTIDKHKCFHNRTQFNTDILDRLRLNLNETFDLMIELSQELHMNKKPTH